MKRVLIGLVCLTFATISFAGSILDVSGNEHDRIWIEMKNNWHELATGGTLTNGLTVTGTIAGTTVTASSSMTLKSRAVPTGSSTDIYVIEAGACSSAVQLNSTTVTQTFSTSFTTAPTVVITDANGGTNAVTSATNQFTVLYGATNITCNYIAIGKKTN